GSLLMTIDDPTPQPAAYFGFQDVTPNSPGDVNHDGVADIYGEGWLQDGATGIAAQGQAWVFSGTPLAGTAHNALPLYTINDPHPVTGGQFGWSMTSTTWKNGQPLLYVGASPHFVPTPPTGANQNGSSNLFDAATGALFKELPMPQKYQQAGTAADHGPELGWSVSAPGPLSAGAAPSYVASAPFWDSTTNVDEGLILTFTPPQYSPAYCPPNPIDGSPSTTPCP
ncbi:MAG: hypothetical protein LC772_11100, partial [Chloroflexi bacterium]|nr:hypothetical protein [Chloroflexota bacterium]